MNGEESLSHLPERVRFALRRERLMAQGRYDAFVFVQECRGDIACLKEKIHWYKELMSNPPDDWKGPMSPDSSVRMHKDGYLPGLQDALNILLQAEQSQPQAVTRVAEPASNTYRVTAKKKASPVKRPPKQTRKTGRQVRRPKQKGTS